MNLLETMSKGKFLQSSAFLGSPSGCRGQIALFLSALFLVSGCATNKLATPAAPTTVNTSPSVAASSGNIHSGALPITGASIQLYAVGGSGDGSAATPMLTSTALSDTSGSFSIAGLYECPSATTDIYLTATGGDPSLTSGATNAQSVLMAALGPCGNVSSKTPITVNEVTTVAAVAALAPFLESYTAVGSASSDASKMADAFTTAAELANFSTGSAPGADVPAGQDVPTQKLNSLAGILSTCVHSVGGKAGDGSPCGQLFSLAASDGASSPTDTVSALLNIVQNPTSNVIPIFDLGPAEVPFQPSLTSSPADWSFGMGSTAPAQPPAPTLYPLPGSIQANTLITLTDVDPSAVMYYSTDGSTPTSSSNRYAGAFSLSKTSTVRAVAIAGSVSSLLAVGTYVVSPSAGPPPALGLVFLASPINVISGAAISPALQIAVEDQAGNVIQSYANPITVGLADGSNGNSIAGTLSASPINGVATFNDVVVTQPGSAYRLAAAGAGINGAVSASFAVMAPPATVTVKVAPTSINLATLQTQTFTANFSDGSNPAVTWTISPATGSISAAGIYTAPATVPSPSTVTVTATSNSNASETASAVVTIEAATGATYYLSSSGSDSNSGLTSSSPWLTPNHPLNCGDTILASPSSSYNAGNFSTGHWGNVSCSAGQAVAWLKCATFDGCKISTGNSDGMHVSASNWGVQGWEATTGTGGGGCFTAQPTSKTVSLHNVIFANDIANGCGGSGFNTYDFGSAGVDYLALIGNIAFHAAQGSGECYSGISIYEPIKYDSLPGTHIYVAGNMVWGNVDPGQCGGTFPTDGEGILFDTFDGSQTSGNVPYTQQAVMTNNITVGNGNSGVKVYQNDVGSTPYAQLYMTHNTTWGNTTATNESGSECAELMLIATTNTQVSGNLSVAKSADSCGGNPLYAYYVVSSPTTTNSMNDNWGYSPGGNNGGIGGGSTGFSFGTGNIFGQNPSLANPSIPGAPNCSAASSVPTCMATMIANFTPKNAAATSYGYQTPSASSTHDPLFPQWLCNVKLPSGLVTMGCSN